MSFYSIMTYNIEENIIFILYFINITSIKYNELIAFFKRL